MKQTRFIMGMHITVEVVEKSVRLKDVEEIFQFFDYVDQKFSPFKETSEVSQINNGSLQKNKYSQDMKKILLLCEQTKLESNGYFNIKNNGKINPSGVVKGWAIWQAAQLLKKKGFKNFYVDAGGDVQVAGKNTKSKKWTVGIQNPFDLKQIVKIVALETEGIATSGTSIRGQHIYNPHSQDEPITDIVSLTVIGPNVYEADRFATPAFAMGAGGINFIEKLNGFEGYMIDKNGIATSTSGFGKYVI